MKFHKVEVDSEVFQYVQAHAEPLVDTFNSALRRLLLVSDPKSDKPKHEDLSPPQSNGLLPNLSRQTPQALWHTLEVAYLVRGGGYDRPSATQFVAKLHNVLPQTVLNKYCRQLNVKAREFDRLLEQPDSGSKRNFDIEISRLWTGNRGNPQLVNGVASQRRGTACSSAEIGQE